MLRGQAAAPMLMQRGLVLWRCGRTDEALEAYRRALPTLRRFADRLMEARLYNNRSLVYIDRGELVAAEADLLRVAALARAEGQAGMAADAETNLGYLNLRRGDVPAALGFLETAEATYRAQDVRPRELLLTRGELLLSVGAFDEARQTAERAIDQLTAAGLAVPCWPRRSCCCPRHSWPATTPPPRSRRRGPRPRCSAGSDGPAGRPWPATPRCGRTSVPAS